MLCIHRTSNSGDLIVSLTLGTDIVFTFEHFLHYMSPDFGYLGFLSCHVMELSGFVLVPILPGTSISFASLILAF
ncbi:hypothetical protein GGR53DRAFT_495703 [Hypoxylon sp. FL1150]|nr:hypothetical protein GGR53DRAFT_495703 [Hypoxylon sp. FL1150]